MPQPPSLLDFDPPEHFNQAAFLADRHVTEGRGARVAYRFGDRQITYEQLVSDANRAGNALVAIGLERGQRAAVVMPDRPELVFMYLGAMKAGIIPVPLNPLQSAEEIAYCIDDGAVSAIAVDEQYVTKVAEARQLAQGDPVVISLSESGTRFPGTEDYHAIVDAQADVLSPAETHRDDMAFWMYSSGTTGRPSAVVHRHRDVVYYQPPFAESVLGIGPDDTLLATSKMFFSYGRNASIEMPLLYGASAVLFPDRPNPESVLDAIATHRPTIFLSVPTFYAALMEHARQADRACDLSSVRLAVSSGEALPETLFERWRKTFGLEIIETLGSTDAGAQYLSNHVGAVKAGSAGKLLPRFESRIVDERGEEVPAGAAGTLLLRGTGTAPLYWNRPDQSKAAFREDGWLDTGDLMRVDDDGYHWFLGRSNDTFKVRGMWLVPSEIENALLAHEAVLECAIVERQDERGLSQAKAVVVTRDGHEPGGVLVDDLRKHLSRCVAPYKVPALWEFTDALPRTTNGKVQRFLLRG